MHLVLIEDKNGDTVDANYYCSDFCAKADDNYNGWNGCHELERNDYCNNCCTEIVGV